jgi:hypothetical protein
VDFEKALLGISGQERMKMKRTLQFLCVLLLISVLGFARSTKYKTVFANPVARPVDFSKVKMAAFVMIPDEGIREGREETLAGELRQRGIDCMAGYLVLPAKLLADRAKAIEHLKQRKIDAVILMRLVGDEERLTYQPGMSWYAMPYYPTFTGYWNYGWAAVYDPGYVWKDRVVTLETLLYSISNDELIWAGRSETENPKDIKKFVKDLIDATGKELRKAALVKK